MGVITQQAALANLLDAVLFHASAAATLGDDAALELADWACRRLLYLNTAAHTFAAAPGETFNTFSHTRNLAHFQVETPLMSHYMRFRRCVCSLLHTST